MAAGRFLLLELYFYFPFLSERSLIAEQSLISGRVTSLGEFSPIGQFFLCAVFLKNYGRSPNFRDTIYHWASYVLAFTKNGFGLHFGRFFTNTSGHPEFSGNILML
jgi:hypothetical protein